MTDETLTTAPEEEQVNSTIEEDVSSEADIAVVEETPVNPDEASTEDDAYAKAWETIDIDKVDVEQLDSTTVQNEQVEDAEPASIDEIREANNAFMVDRPTLKFKGRKYLSTHLKN